MAVHLRCSQRHLDTDAADCDGDDTETVTAVAVPIAFSVIDSWGVIDTNIVTVFIIDNPDKPKAEAGANQQVSSGDFVRLNAILSSDPDPGTQLTFEWRYIGMVTTDPLTQNRRPITAAEVAQGFVEGKWFPYDGVSYVRVPDTTADADDIPDLMQVFSNHTLGATAPTPTTVDDVAVSGVRGGSAWLGLRR